MTAQKNEDLLGLAPYGRAIEKATSKSLNAAGIFLDAVCMPAAKEFGLYLNDKVSEWRQNNVATMLIHAKELAEPPNRNTFISPKSLHRIIEASSWEGDGVVNRLWAGLFAASLDQCDGNDDQLFIETLQSLSPTQAKLLLHTVESSKVQTSKLGLLFAFPRYITIPNSLDIVGYKDVQRLDREMDDLSRKYLIHRGILLEEQIADITPTALALHLVARCVSGRNCPLTFCKEKGLVATTIPADEFLLQDYLAKNEVLPGKYDTAVEEERKHIAEEREQASNLENK